jgi:ATP-dependent helicase/nuclease subunit A
MQPSLFDAPVDDVRPADQAARDFATSPDNHVVLEASAGTGKTRVLVDRYVRLIEAGVDPQHILAITFTRKAAAEMRERVLDALRRGALERPRLMERWRVLRARVADIAVSTIDAFCFSLLREFPLEAGVDPAFEIADETEMSRFVSEAIDLTLRAARGLFSRDETVRLLFARVKLPVLREALGSLVDRRHVALPAVATFVDRQVHVRTAAEVGASFVARVRDLMAHSPHQRALLDDGPLAAPEFAWLRADLEALDEFVADDVGRVQQLARRLERYFLRDDGKPRAQVARRFVKQFASAEAKKRHEAALKALGFDVLEILEALSADVNGLLARGLLRVLTIAVEKYEHLLDEHALLDFAAMLDKTVTLLARQEEFARSRLKLQSRYHHVLVDEFQDTNRLQWRLIELLIDAWQEGEGLADGPTSIFVVGDRKQSIYRFRHAEVRLLDEAGRKIAALRPGRTVRQAITHSFRAVPELLAFVNAVAEAIQGDPQFDERFSYGETDRFQAPGVAVGARRDGEPVLGLIAESSMSACASAVAAEIQRVLATTVVRDRQGPPRRARPDDIAILFRARAGHQYFEEALEARGIRTYVYKGLGFFDAPEVQDLQALMRYLAQPESDLRAAELLRSRLVRVSDTGLVRLAPGFARALGSPAVDLGEAGLGPLDRAILERTRESLARWLSLADRVAPSELLDLVLGESAYAFELRGRRLDQARENVKKVRALVRRVESRGYATLGRLGTYFDSLKTGEESNAIIEASGCVSLMTIHAAKGLEFPVVFVVNVHGQGRGRSSGFSVIDRGPNGEPVVAFGATEATRLDDQREAEELRRLFYVAVTRARDRLYFAGELDKKGKLRRGTRSLASLFPSDLAEVFALAAATSAGEVEWQSQSGVFAFRACRPAPDAPAVEAEPALPAPADLDALSVPAPGIVTASGLSASRPTARAARPGTEGPPSDDRLVGTLVHRLFQRHPDPSGSPADVAEHLSRWVSPDELVDVADPRATLHEAARLFLLLRDRDEIKRLLASGQSYYEVAFSYWPPDRPAETVRGSIDCVVVAPTGQYTVLEFKTGTPRPEHQQQVELYVQALRAAIPAVPIEASVVYP